MAARAKNKEMFFSQHLLSQWPHHFYTTSYIASWAQMSDPGLSRPSCLVIIFSLSFLLLCLGKAVLREHGISQVHSLIFFLVLLSCKSRLFWKGLLRKESICSISLLSELDIFQKESKNNFSCSLKVHQSTLINVSWNISLKCHETN